VPAASPQAVSIARLTLRPSLQALAESGIAFDAKETAITAGSKPEWFTDVYRKALGADLTSDGKVPVIVVKGAGADGGDFVLTESAVIVDYVANKYAPQLLPKTPEDRARGAIFAEQVIGKVRHAARLAAPRHTLLTIQPHCTPRNMFVHPSRDVFVRPPDCRTEPPPSSSSLATIMCATCVAAHPAVVRPAEGSGGRRAGPREGVPPGGTGRDLEGVRGDQRALLLRGGHLDRRPPGACMHTCQCVHAPALLVMQAT